LQSGPFSEKLVFDFFLLMYRFLMSACHFGRLPALAVAALAVACGLETLLAQATSTQPAADETEVIARRMLAVINDGTGDTLRDFVRTNFSELTLQGTPVEQVVALFQTMRKQSGGLDIVKVLPPEMPGQANLLLRTRQGKHFLRLVLFATGIRINDFFPLNATDPQGDITTVWPTNKVSLARIRREIDRHAAFGAARDIFSGVVLVAQGDRPIFLKAYGMAEKSFQSQNRPDTKFNLGSLDKMFTGLALAQLVAAGKLSFADTLAKVLPDYPNTNVAKRVTMHQLLTHTSGLGEAFKREMREQKKRFRSPRDYFPLFAVDDLLFEPGTGWSYSNAGYIVLGAVIEEISGQSYEAYVREHVFNPAGMKDTGYYELDQVVTNLAVGYGRFEDDVLGVSPRRNNSVFLGYKGNPAGGGYSTAADLLAFARALHGHRLLSADMTELVTRGKAPAGGDHYGYGFWQWSGPGNLDLRGNSGGGPSSGINAELRMFWRGPYTVVVLSNYDAPSATQLARAITEFLANQM
jgi:D-alanyl-D-alanine carboxypeptidase